MNFNFMESAYMHGEFYKANIDMISTTSDGKMKLYIGRNGDRLSASKICEFKGYELIKIEVF